MGYIDLIRQILDGELVRAGIANRPTQELDQNVRYLKDLIEAAFIGQTVIARERTVEIDAKVGQPVYFHAGDAEFKRAIGSVEVDENGLIVTSASTQVLGIVLSKQNATKADILIHGLATVDLSQATIDTPVPGSIYYLSNAAAGRLTADRPPVGVDVLQVTQAKENDTYEVFVSTRLHDLLESHKHYRFELVALPAGDVTPPTPYNPHVISSPNSALAGWLPADDAIFDSKAPAGAVFGYNLSVSPLQNLWPPLPLQGATIEILRPPGQTLSTVPDEVVLINRDGIWWMTDCYDSVPWPTDFVTGDSVSDHEDLSSCPQDLPLKVYLWFSKPTFHTNGTAVLSLQAHADSGLIITCVDTGEPATTGHLDIDLDLDMNVHPDGDESGSLVLKRFENNTFYRGLCVESLEAGSSNVTLTSDLPDDAGKFYGNVNIEVALDIEGSELSVDSVRLNGVTEEFYQSVIALGFDQNKRASYRGRVLVSPQLVLEAGTKMKLRFLVLNRANANVPDSLFSLDYRVLSWPSALLTPVSLPLTDTSLADLPDTAVTITVANQYFYMESEAFDITAGDTVFFTLERRGDTDGFPGNVHIMRQRGVLVAP